MSDPPQKPKSPTAPERHPGIANAFYAAALLSYSALALQRPRFWVVVASMLVFTLICYSVPVVVRGVWPEFYKKFYSQTGPASAWRQDKWVNLAVSMVHSSITTVTAIVAVATVWHEYADGADWLKAPQSSSLPVIVLAITNGYCAYDTWDMLRIGMARQAMNLMVHHGLLLIAFYLSLQLDMAVWYMTLSMLCEVNSVFLHLRVLLGMAGHDRSNSIVLRGVWWLLFTTMYTTRLPVHAYLFIRLLIGQDVWQTSIVPYYIPVMVMFGFTALNYKLNRNVSKAYDKSRSSVRSKRILAIDLLASWVWPVGSVTVGLLLYVIQNRPAK